MLSSELHKHLDGMDELEQQMQDDIDMILINIDKKALINDPSGVMNIVVEDIKLLLEEKYIPLASKLGLSLNETLNTFDEKGDKIIIDSTKDADINEGILDDNGID